MSRTSGDDESRPHPLGRPPAPNERLRRLRARRGWTQAQMAAALGLTTRGYQDLESGRVSRPRRQTLDRLYALTGLDRPDLLGFRSSRRRPLPAARLDGERLVAAAADVLRGNPPAAIRRLLAPPAAPRPARAGESDLDQVRHHAEVLAAMDERFGGASVRPAALSDALCDATVLLHAPAAAPGVRAAVADLSLTVGAMFTDQADYPAAQATLLVALAATRNAGPDCAALRTRVLAALARQSVYARDYPTAHRLLDIADALAGHPRVPADLRAGLLALRACATGPLGYVRDTIGLVHRAQDLAASAGTVTWPGHFGHDCGLALATLELCCERPLDNAASVLADAIDRYQPAHRRSRAISRAFLMMTLLARGDGDAALRVATGLLADTPAIHSAQLRESLALTHLVRPGDPDGEAVREALHTFRPPAPGR